MNEAGTIGRRTVLAAAGAVAIAASGHSLHVRASQASPVAGADGSISGSAVTIRRFRLKPGADPAVLVERVRDGFVPIVTAIPGFWEYRLVLSEDRTVTSINVFASPAGADESNAKSREWATATIADLSELPAFETIVGTLAVDADAY